uniref:Secreted protein n=1 Tax=Zea mays TaxID=4577 RepID=A0A804MUV0_MAIZE
MFSMALPLALTLRLSLPLPPPSCPLPRRRSQAPPPHSRDLVLGHLLQLRLCFVVRALPVPRRVRVGPAHDSHDVTPRLLAPSAHSSVSVFRCLFVAVLVPTAEQDGDCEGR